jgi:hypothetical protein
MTQPKFNDPDLYLLKNWTNARLLEDSMDKVREKYADLFSDVLDRVIAKHKNLDCRGMRLNDHGGYVNVGLGRECWPQADHKWPSGLWIAGVTLEDLASQEGEAPSAAIWINPPKGSTLDLQKATRRIEAEAKELLKVEIHKSDDEEDGIEWELPESRQELLGLLQNGEVQCFADRMVGHFELMARFIPLLNQVFESSAKKT